MEIPPTLTPPVLRLLNDTFPESLPILYSLRNKAVTSLITDNPSNPSFIVATIQRRDKNNANTNENGGKLESFLVATDNIDAAARALPRGTVLFYAREDYVDAILRAWPEGEVPPPPKALTDGARVRKLTVDDADVVNKHWGRGGGMCREYIATQIARQGGFGVETSSGELASWLVRYETEEVGMGFTLEQHRGKRYLSAVAYAVDCQQKKDGVATTHFFTHITNQTVLHMGTADEVKRADGLHWRIALV
eukprot:m51a1_g8744 hypothetical protein (250) ;mRNA; f:43042-44086